MTGQLSSRKTCRSPLPDRDYFGTLVNPYLHGALNTPRFRVNDQRTARARDKLFQSDCMPSDSIFYGVGARVDEDGNIVEAGRVSGTLGMEIDTWSSHSLSTLVVAILTQELLGYEVSFFQASGSADMTQRMSTVGTGICSPTQVNVEVWLDAATQRALAVYYNESSFVGSVGYDGLAGLFTSCKDSCSKSKACTTRESKGGECLVVIMMDASYDVGYLQASLSNNDIPAYFCFLGISGAAKYVSDALASNTPVAFYSYQPDEFFQRRTGQVERVALPWATPEQTALHTGGFGENGYGEVTDNPVRVDFPRVTLACNWLRKPENYQIWRQWLEPLPDCEFDTHFSFSLDGCEANTDGEESFPRRAKFYWKSPRPDNISLPYTCDPYYLPNSGLPGTLTTSRSCSWLTENTNTWIIWASLGTQPICDTSFYTYDVSDCTGSGLREVTFRWLLPEANNATFSSECTDGKALPDPVLIDCEYIPYNTAASKAVFFLACLLACVMLGCIGFVVYEREQPIVKRSQYQFLVTMLLGGALMCFATVIYSDAPSRVVCALRPALISWAFTLIFGSLVVKSMRVYRVFLSSAMKRVVLSAGSMIKVLAGFLVVDIVILVSWQLVSPSDAIVKAEAVAEIGGLAVDRVRCASSSSVFVGLLFFWKAGMLFGGLYLSILIRKVSSDFQESLWIFASACVVLFSSLLLLPMGYFVTLSATVFFLFFSFIVLSATMLVLGLMLVPKMMRLHDLATSGASEVSKTIREKQTASSGSESDAQVAPLPLRLGASRGSRNNKNGKRYDQSASSVGVSIASSSSVCSMRLPGALFGSTVRRGVATRRALARREKSTLSYRVFEDSSSGQEPTKTALVIHGILGNKLNWRTFSQKLTKANPDWRFICLDLRVEPTAVLGHSFGGKVALTYLQQCMQHDRAPPSQVWVLDSLPGTGATDYASRDLTNSIETILPVVKKIPLPIRSKAQLVKDLQGHGVALGEAQWLTTNLRLTSKNPELYEWKMDVDVIEQLFQSFLASDLWPVVENPPVTEGKDVEIHFVHASKNNMWTSDLLDRLDAQQDNQNCSSIVQASTKRLSVVMWATLWLLKLHVGLLLLAVVCSVPFVDLEGSSLLPATICSVTDGTANSDFIKTTLPYLFGEIPASLHVIVESYVAGKSCALTMLSSITVYQADGKCHKTAASASYMTSRAADKSQYGVQYAFAFGDAPNWNDVAAAFGLSPYVVVEKNEICGDNRLLHELVKLWLRKVDATSNVCISSGFTDIKVFTPF
ncbi:serine protease family S33, putative [Phytophthora infestans T30-4]|uniref:Serine protease family S33, putative n=1 Tax=Phytophthora infestans (strain T30-4) TaxID=403677 RepID=D0N838_PHYIT|nr:serine protease family S33, putative [Phytophthora infestans T30-4]EEY53155.1 serine protease family S33, putative [Phytophthora infestans T30-4]|eukprot:XP_002904773.1 serine protease family S33, putative [Phytophthora infestans T30-4]